MKEFEVTITETLQKSVVVEADSKDDAIQMVEDMWKDADIILCVLHLRLYKYE